MRNSVGGYFPSWSIHSGVGTSEAYAVYLGAWWENRVFDDMWLVQDLR